MRSESGHAMQKLTQQYPGKVAITIGYNESLAHQIEAGADIFLMPSRFEPCGLNQFYSLKYGTVPIVHNTGGLADSVEDVTAESITNGTATGFKFYEMNSDALIAAFFKALHYFQQAEIWRQIQLCGMKTDFSWTKSAQNYVALYQKAIESQEDTIPK